MSVEQSIVNDVVDVKEALAEDWGKILSVAQQIENMLTDALDWLKNEENLPKIREVFEGINFSSIDIPDDIFSDVIDRVKEKLDPILNELQTLKNDLDPQSLISLVDQSFTTLPSLPGISGLNMSTVKSVATALSDAGSSVALKDLSTVNQGSEATPGQTGSNSVMDALFGSLDSHFDSFLTTHQDKIKATMANLQSVVTPETIGSLADSSESLKGQLNSAQFTTSGLFKFVTKLISNEAEKAKEIAADLISQFIEEAENLQEMMKDLHDLLTNELEEDSNLYEIYQAFTHSINDPSLNSIKTPSLLGVVSIVLAIPMKSVFGDKLPTATSLSQGLSGQQIREARNYGDCQIADGILPPIIDVIADFVDVKGDPKVSIGFSVISQIATAVLNLLAQLNSKPSDPKGKDSPQTKKYLSKTKEIWEFQWFLGVALPVLKLITLPIAYKWETIIEKLKQKLQTDLSETSTEGSGLAAPLSDSNDHDEDHIPIPQNIQRQEKISNNILALYLVHDLCDVIFELVHLGYFMDLLDYENQNKSTINPFPPEGFRTGYSYDPIPGIAGSGASAIGKGIILFSALQKKENEKVKILTLGISDGIDLVVNIVIQSLYGALYKKEAGQ